MGTASVKSLVAASRDGGRTVPFVGESQNPGTARAFAGYVRHVRACADKCGASAKVQPRAASEARAGSVAEEIHEALALGPLRRGKIAKATGRHPMTIYYRCREMVERGELERDAENRYWLAGKKTTRVTAREVPENKKAGNGKALATATSLLHPKIVEALRGGGLTAEAMGRKIAGEKYSGVDAATQGMLDRAVERGELELRAGVYFLAEL